MSLEMLWGEETKCSATVVGLDLALSKLPGGGGGTPL